ncbi:bifunctional DNA-binding transcriptional regulator/O6-methylguanine-DNA methyltransferase Ada [Rhizosaccharibacter radicis]|uniref:Bifunctional DNA-binding transcriptional regulator/O6-methylguanine-DNA methyltransferase Ada n=1 Tax=Rhizosaccharibacter radicis TaxID=2782605 RepID=A0ABT1VTK4_9PROT|nr:bifunctional DNA-binding transcriptional regulator/O6-methylguanine-DNA methyltransferase Ada [Acetobacteraceae bacterium KSS12]
MQLAFPADHPQVPPPETSGSSAGTRSAASDPRWPLILARDPAADGSFWYSVQTTGVYCRPSCPSRAARPENVRLHDTLEAARATGCRPCRRCRPDEAAHHRDAALVVRACRLIDAAERPPAHDELARKLEVGSARLRSAFEAVLGLSPKRYADARRAERLRLLLPVAATVTEAFHQAGFGSSSRFYDKAAELLGMAPNRVRAGAAAETLRVAVAPCSLGAVLVAAGERGLVAVLLGDDPDLLRRDLRARFPRAGFGEADEAFGAVVAQVVALVETPGASHALPLDIRGTAFQRRVWDALRDVETGRTLSYAELAARAGAPAAVRAVAGACAANPLAVAVPCHRAVRTDGGLGGYRWGLARKRILLDREAASSTAGASSTAAAAAPITGPAGGEAAS